ncbi:MAG: sensor domain-containing diguanylate cyclase [Lamprobacter sp.]|uniref:sensor domain-containing diguanylate cyclase n=1 Tax=Lamprobacter sp. TaxID=3100796 RepID=UPI002B25E02C|nr:sensor domain-containing diguanylate cyclase [Lamprobacter sp.]MEA3643488.1 sensor domain-containing diguanylate cyclase [Lamprobacter sp.]
MNAVPEPALDAGWYQRFLRHAPDAVFILNAQGQLLEYSELARTQLGYSHAEMRQLSIFDWDSDMEPESFKQLLQTLSRGPLRLERRHRHKYGAIYQADTTLTLLEADGRQLIMACVRDSSEQRALADTVLQQRDELAAIFDQVLDGIAVLDSGARVLRANQHMARLFGITQESLLEHRFTDFLSDNSRQRLFEMIAEARRRSRIEGVALPYQRNRQARLMRLSLSLLPHTTQFLISARDITEARREMETLRRNSETDPMTEIGNRRAYQRSAEALCYAYERYQRQFCLLVFDIDDFKDINDRLGHPVGDQVLIALVHTVRTVMRQSDQLFRIGGEEFAILLHEADNAAARIFCDKLLAQIRSAPEVADRPVTISIGVAQVSEGDTVQSLFARADANLYLAKRAGKNCAIVD